MRNRWLLNLALGVFLLALALLVYFRPTPDDQKAKAANPLTPLKADSITQIRIQRPNEKEISLVKDGDEWRIDAPLKARADRIRVENILQIASADVSDRFASGDLKQYGLEPPQARVWLNDTDIRFGQAHALQALHYVAYAGEIALVPAGSFRAADVALNDLLSTSLLEKDRRPIGFDLPGRRLMLHDGQWRLTPPKPEISSDRLNTFAEEWRFARAMSVSPHKPRPALGRVTIQYQPEGDKATKPGSVAFDILAREPEVILYRPDEGLDYHLPPDVGERLLAPKNE